MLELYWLCTKLRNLESEIHWTLYQATSEAHGKENVGERENNV